MSVYRKWEPKLNQAQGYIYIHMPPRQAVWSEGVLHTALAARCAGWTRLVQSRAQKGGAPPSLFPQIHRNMCEYMYSLLLDGRCLSRGWNNVGEIKILFCLFFLFCFCFLLLLCKNPPNHMIFLEDCSVSTVCPTLPQRLLSVRRTSNALEFSSYNLLFLVVMGMP